MLLVKSKSDILLLFCEEKNARLAINFHTIIVFSEIQWPAIIVNVCLYVIPFWILFTSIDHLIMVGDFSIVWPTHRGSEFKSVF